jgi:tetratricopeptide (TPR) repeat protein
MNKIKTLSIALVLVSGTVFAQQNKVVSAWNYYKPEYELLDKAKSNIDDAAVHESTMGKPKTWYYRGLIYQKIYKHAKYGNLDEMALEKAYESYKKALELDPNYEFKDEVNQNISALSGDFFTRGLDEFNAKDFNRALISFEWVLKIRNNDMNALQNSALCAERLAKWDIAKSYYQKILTVNQKDPLVFLSLSNIQKREGDVAGAIQTISEGRKLFPSDNKLIISQLDLYLGADKIKEASELIEVAISGDPTNASLHFAKGTLFDKMGNKEVAAQSYVKAIELNNSYFDANYNLGAMYFNQAAEMVNTANNLPPNKVKEYDLAKAKYEAKFREAMPYLERAHEINPKDMSTMESLKQLYARLGQTEKSSAMKKKMEENK